MQIVAFMASYLRSAKLVMPDMKLWLKRFMEDERLPESFIDVAEQFYKPLAQQVQTWVEQSDQAIILGVNGGQGTGKSTLSGFIGHFLEHSAGLSTCIISIDDLYLTKEDRLELANTVHPLFATRGVPGTHDVEYGIKLITELKAGKLPKIPRFNKATDQPFAVDTWQAPEKVPDLIIFEGWCVGASAEPAYELVEPINVLEEKEDPDGAWRTFVNMQLMGKYAELYGLIDHLAMLKAPSFECIHGWRTEQEEKLAAKVAQENGDGSGIMSANEIKRFISHYERITRWMLEDIPPRADCIFHLNKNHSINSASIKGRHV